MKDLFALLNPVQNEALLNQTNMKTQVNIPHGNVELFEQCCEMNQVDYLEVEATTTDSIFEIEYDRPAILFYLGAGYGIRSLSQDLTSKK